MMVVHTTSLLTIVCGLASLVLAGKQLVSNETVTTPTADTSKQLYTSVTTPTADVKPDAIGDASKRSMSSTVKSKLTTILSNTNSPYASYFNRFESHDQESGCTAKEFKGLNQNIQLSALFSAALWDGGLQRIVADSGGIILGTYRLNQGSTDFVVHDCSAQDKSYVEVKNIATADHKARPWLTIVSVSFKFFYGRLLSGRENMKLEGTGKAKLDGQGAGEFDMSFSFDNTTDRNFITKITLPAATEVSSSTFVAYFGLTAASLYPPDAIVTFQRDVNALKFTNVKISFVPSGEDDMYAGFMEGTVSTGDLAGMSDLLIYCSFDVAKDNVCALLGKDTLTNSNLYKTIVDRFPVSSVSTQFRVLPTSKRGESILFHSSKGWLEDVSAIPWYDDVQDVIINPDEKKIRDRAKDERKEIFSTQEGINPMSCFRYSNKQSYYSFIYLVDVCPTGDSFRFFFPDLPQRVIQAHFIFVYEDHQIVPAGSFKTWLSHYMSSSSGDMILEYVDVSLTEIRMSLKANLAGEPPNPAPEDETPEEKAKKPPHLIKGGFQLIRNHDIVLMRESSIEIVIRNGNEVSLEGSGEEEILGAEGTFDIDGPDDATFTIFPPSNHMLMFGIKESLGGDNMQQNNEFDTYDDGYKTPFEALKNMSLINVTMKTSLMDVNSFKLEAGAAIGDTDAKFFVYLYNTFHTKSCFYKDDGGKLQDIVEAIQEKSFIDQSWLAYGQIGFLFSDNVPDSNVDVCMGSTERLHKQESVGVNVKDFIFDNCVVEVKEMDNSNNEVIQQETMKGCLYLQSIFPAKKIETVARGLMSKEKLVISGKLDSSGSTFKLTPSGSIQLRPETVEYAVKPSNPDETGKVEQLDYIKITCTLFIPDVETNGIWNMDMGINGFRSTAKSYPFWIYVSGDMVKLYIKSPNDGEGGAGAIGPSSLMIYGGTTFPYGFCVWIYLKKFEKIKPSEDAQTRRGVIEMNARMVFSRDQDQSSKISFFSRQIVRQFIDASNPQTDSKFYACKDSTKRVLFRQLLHIVRIHWEREGWFKDALIKDLCIAHNPDASPWEFAGRTFPTGFTIEGKLEVDFRTWGKTFVLPLSAEIVPARGIMVTELCVRVPIQRWGARTLQEWTAPVAGANDQEDKEIKDKKIKDVVQGERFLVEDTKCALQVDYDADPAKSTKDPVSSQNTKEDCVKHCVEKAKTEGTSYDGITMVMQAAKVDCTCVQNMKATIKSTGVQTCFMEEFRPHLLGMYAEKGEGEELGPQFCYRPLYGGAGGTEMFLKGYLKTFAFEKENAEIRIAQSGGDPYIDHEEKGVKLYDEVVGNIHLKSRTIGAEPSSTIFQYKISIPKESVCDQGSRKKIQAALEEIIGRDKGQITAIKEVQQKNKLDLEQFKATVDSTIQQFNKKAKAHEQRFQVESMQRARAMNAYDRDCSAECGYVRIPGWSVDNKCSTNKQGDTMPCMKFKNDTNIASNVGCVANCEAERTKSYVEAKDANAKTRAVGVTIDQNAYCRNRGDDLKSKIDEFIAIAQGDIKLAESDEKAYDLLLKGKAQFAKAITKKPLTMVNFRDARSEVLPNPRCLRLSWKFKLKVPGETQERSQNIRNKQVCFNGFWRSFTERTYKEVYDRKRIAREFKTIQRNDARLKAVLRWQGENKLSRQGLVLKEQFDNCRQYMGLKAEKRSIDKLPAFNRGDFSIFGEGTVESFEEHSPWSVAKKRDVLGELLTSEGKISKKTISYPANETACSAAKRASIDYSNIASYIHKWAQEQQSAKRSLLAMKETANKDWQGSSWNSYMIRVNASVPQLERMKYWSDRTKEGMKEWVALEDAQIQRYNKESLPFIRKQLDYAYTDDNHKTLRDFFTHRGVDGNNAFKRAKIDAASPEPFSDLSKTLLETLENGKSLEEISGPIEEAMRRTAVLQKRTIQCSA